MFIIPLKQFLRWISYTFAITIVLWFFIKNGGFEIFKPIINLNFMPWGILALVLFLSAVFLGTLQWKLLLRTKKIRVSFSSLFKSFYLGLFFNSIFFSNAGEISKAYKLKKAGVIMSQGLFVLLLDRYMGFFTLSIMFFLSCLLTLFNIIQTPILNRFLWISTLLFLFSSLLLPFLFSNTVRHRFFKVIYALISWKYLLSKFKALENQNNQHKTSKILDVCIIIFVSFGVQSIKIISFYCCIRSLNINLHPLYLFCFVPVMSLCLILPFNIGGWGLPQTIGIELFSLPGVISTPISPPTHLIASAIILPTLTFYLVSLLGGIFIFSKIKLK